MDDIAGLSERLRISLAGVAREESGGDNLAILLASYFEPGIEDEELDDSGTWKQGALDACDKVLDAIHAHYATQLDALQARVKELENDAIQQEYNRLEWIKRAEAEKARATRLQQKLDEAYERCLRAAKSAPDLNHAIRHILSLASGPEKEKKE